MMYSRPSRRLCAAVFAFAATASIAAPGRAASCPPFPYVAWWGDMTHETVTTAVRQRYNGDFSPVINMLVQELAKMEEAHGRAQSYAVPSTTRRLGGPQLTVYMHQTRLAVSVLRCLETKAAKRPETVRPTAARADSGGRS
jgi:hypothetical protein